MGSMEVRAFIEAGNKKARTRQWLTSWIDGRWLFFFLVVDIDRGRRPLFLEFELLSA